MKKEKHTLREAVKHNIRGSRIEAGLTQQQVATKTGFKVSFVARLETNPQNISLDTLETIALALNQSPDQLLKPRFELKVRKKELQFFEDAMKMLRAFEKIIINSKLS